MIIEAIPSHSARSSRKYNSSILRMLLKERLLRRTNISSENTHISSTQLTVNANCETTHFDCLVRVMGDQRWCVYFEILGYLPGSFNAIFTDKFSVISRGRSADIPTREHPSLGEVAKCEPARVCIDRKFTLSVILPGVSTQAVLHPGLTFPLSHFQLSQHTTVTAHAMWSNFLYLFRCKILHAGNVP